MAASGQAEQVLQPPADAATSSPSALKLEPQPQEATALGLLTVNPWPMRPSTKSTSAPLRYGRLKRSTTIFTPCWSTTSSPGCGSPSNPSAYCMPEQPPPCTATRSASASGSSLMSASTCSAARSVSVTMNASYHSRASAPTRLCDNCTERPEPACQSEKAAFPPSRWARVCVLSSQRAGPLGGHPRLHGFLGHDRRNPARRIRLPGQERPPARQRQEPAVRVRRLHGRLRAVALLDLLLPDRDALHRLRHRDRLPLPARRAAARARAVRVHGAAGVRRAARHRLC